jgi:hypothetical protein
VNRQLRQADAQFPQVEQAGGRAAQGINKNEMTIVKGKAVRGIVGNVADSEPGVEFGLDHADEFMAENWPGQQTNRQQEEKDSRRDGDQNDLPASA